MLTNSFRNIALEDYSYNNYIEAISILENYNYLSENFLKKIPSKVKKILAFIQDIASNTFYELNELLALFKNPKVYSFFKSIAFSFKKLFSIIREGYKNYLKLEKIVFEWLHKNAKIYKLQDKIKLLDKYLETHPIIKKIGGVGVSAILVFIWLRMAYTPDLEYSMSWEDMIDSLLGNYSLADLFASEAGIKMLTLFATGSILGLSFPWPGPQSIHMASGVIYGLYKIVKPNTKIEKPNLRR